MTIKQMNLYDTAGQEKYNSLTISYFRNIDGLLLVYSVDNLQSFKRIDYWLSNVYNYCNKDNIQLFVNSTTSGEGKETIKANYNSDAITISFNSRYLLDIASEIESENITMSLNDAVSPVLILDNSDKHSYFVIMPMKI